MFFFSSWDLENFPVSDT
jgi:hypothetical protein